MLPIQIELLDPRAKPYVGSEQAAGMDLRYCVDTGHAGFTLLRSGQSITFGTGVKAKIPMGWVGKVYPRSGLGCKFEVKLANTVGIIDSDYRGEIMLTMRNCGDRPMDIGDFDRIAQMVIVPHYKVYDNIEVVDKIEIDTERGENGFNSTGTK